MKDLIKASILIFVALVVLNVLCKMGAELYVDSLNENTCINTLVKSGVERSNIIRANGSCEIKIK